MLNMLTHIFISCMIFALTGCSFFSSTSKQSDTLIIGTNSGFPPYEVLNNQGKLEGFDIELGKAIGKILKKKVTFTDLFFDGLILSLKQGKIDVIMAGMSITPSRAEEIAMVHYQGKPLTHFPLVFWEKIPDGVTSIYDLKKLASKTICVQAGNIQEEFISTFDFVEVKHIEQIPQLIMEIKYGKSLACVLEPQVVEALQQQYPELKVLNVPIPKHLQSFGHGIGINKNNTKLIQQITQAVTQLKQQGVIKQLEDKWFGGKHNGN